MAKIIFRANANFNTATSGAVDINGTAECQMHVLLPGGIIKANFGTGLVGIPAGSKVLGSVVSGVLKGMDGVDGIPLLAKNADVQVSGVLNYQAVIRLPSFNTRVVATFPAPTDATPVDLMAYIDATGVASVGLTQLPISGLIGLPQFGQGLLTLADATAWLASLDAPSTGTVNNLLSAKASLTGAETLLQKRITPRVGSLTSSATPTINTDTVDKFAITALSTAVTSMSANLTGAPADGERKQITFKDNGTPRAITWGSNFTGTLLTTTVADKTHVQELVYDANVGKWAGVLADTAGY